jgi:elongation factor Ts
MADCKNALVEAGGDMEVAVEIILKKGLVKAAGKGGRIATEGEVATWISPDEKKGVIVEINTQTDFVARGPEFKRFVAEVLEVAQAAPKGADLGSHKHPRHDKHLDLMRQELVAKTGENTLIRRWDALQTAAPSGFVHAYVHSGGKLAVLIEVEAPGAGALKNADFRNFVDNVAMQVCAMRPTVVAKGDVPQAEIDKQKEIFAAQLKEEGKPEQAWPKILEGKLAKWFTEVTLLGQDNVWDPPAGTIDKLRQDLGKRLEGEIKIVRFVRFELGEGIEKKQDDLAAEVAKMTST